MSQLIDRDKRSRWEGLLRQFPSSGLTVREFCRRRGVSEPSFYDWRRRLGLRSRAITTGSAGGPAVARVPLFVPVRLAAAPPTAAGVEGQDGPGRQGGTGGIELLLGGGATVHTIRLLGEVPAARLAEVLAVLDRREGRC